MNPDCYIYLGICFVIHFKIRSKALVKSEVMTLHSNKCFYPGRKHLNLKVPDVVRQGRQGAAKETREKGAISLHIIPEYKTTCFDSAISNASRASHASPAILDAFALCFYLKWNYTAIRNFSLTRSTTVLISSNWLAVGVQVTNPFSIIIPSGLVSRL